MGIMTRVAAALFALGAVCASSALALPGVLTGPISYNGHDYYLLDTSNWTDAQAKAVSMGGHLATIGSQAEQNWVFQTFNAYDSVNRLYWIGLNDRAVEGQYVWASDEQPAYTYWAPGEPNNAGNEDVVAMYYLGHSASGGWNDWYNGTHDPIGISFSGVVEIAPPIQWAPAAGGNGHYYEYVSDFEITWTQAKAAAEAKSFMGVQGHLATITSEAENDFLVANFSTSFSRSAWLGGWQEEGMAPDQGWQWLSGEPWGYTRWIAGEPNDTGGDERYLAVGGYYCSSACRWLWNDDGNNTDPQNQAGYFIEYPVPEPASAVLLALGVGALLRRRRKNA